MPGNSFLHRIDPRAKLFVAFVAMICLFMVHRFDVLIMGGCLFFLLGYGAGIPAGYLARGMRVVWILALFTLVFNAVLTPGEICCQLGPLHITWEGLERGVAMALRFFLLVLITSLLTLTTSPILLTDAIEQLLYPLKWLGIPAHELALVSTIALRFVPTLAQETDSIMKAQLARGASLDRGSLTVRLRALISILVPLFVSSFRYAEDLAQAMEARCYRGGQGRTRLHELHFHWSDVGAAAIGIMLILSLIAGDLYLG